MKIIFLLLCSLTLAAQEKLEIEGAIIVGESEESSPALGTIRFNSSTMDFEGWNGLYWVSLTGVNLGAVTDIDGNTYKTIEIGNQVWMGENLRTTKYAQGADIPQITGDSEWSMLTFGAWCWYDNMASYELPYGKLYNYHAVEGDSLCPSGWHVPSDDDWNILIDYLDPGTIDPEINGTQSEAAGQKLKEVGFEHWPEPNSGANNESGFTALPGGRRLEDGAFMDGNFYGFWWRATEFGIFGPVYSALGYLYPGVVRGYFSKKAGISVRCIKN